MFIHDFIFCFYFLYLFTSDLLVKQSSLLFFSSLPCIFFILLFSPLLFSSLVFWSLFFPSFLFLAILSFLFFLSSFSPLLFPPSFLSFFSPLLFSPSFRLFTLYSLDSLISSSPLSSHLILSRLYLFPCF